ncbi:MAG TPA: RNA methyltransferase [Verrucomicrobiae bacterium]|nr:RNA methyltransferase [Verrucomicrobiae bacterium]
MAKLRIQQITSLDLPELAPYRTMRRPAAHELERIFVAEGVKVVTRLLESDFPVLSVLFPQSWLAEYEPMILRRPENEITVYVAAEKEMVENLTGYSLFQGVLAVGGIPPSVSLEKILAASPRPRLLVAIDALANAENIGALVRNCVAFGVQGLIIGETSSSPFLRRSVRNSMGTIFQLPVLDLRKTEIIETSKGKKEFSRSGKQLIPPPTLADTLRTLSGQGIRCLAAHPHANGKTISQADFTGDCCVVFGSEGTGITEEVLKACDEAVFIPMPLTVDSLNVGGAAAVFLYEAARQRGLC